MSRLGTGYLLLYNCFQFLGWTAILGCTIHHVSQKGNLNIWQGNVKILTEIFQTLAVLEILHCIVGLVKSSPVTTAIQVYSRVFLVWGICYSVPEIHGKTMAEVMMVSAWCIAEMTRYLYYALNLLGSVPYVVLWLRYSLFIILYPIGISGEIWCIYTALPFVKKTELYSLQLPNRLNVSFSYYIFLILTIASYLPFFPQLYGYMMTQRKRFLYTPKEKRA